MAYYNDGKVFRNLPEQVEKNKSDIESIQDAQKTDESNINTNLNNINAHETRINALESLKMTQDGQNIKLTKSTGEIGNIAVGTVGGTNLLGGNDVTFKTINGESITGEGNITSDFNLSAIFYENFGQYRYAGKRIIYTDWKQKNNFSDPLMPYYTNYFSMFSNAGLSGGGDGTIVFANDLNPNGATTFDSMFFCSNFISITFRNATFKNTDGTFQVLTRGFSDMPSLKSIKIADGCAVKIIGLQLDHTFAGDYNLITLPAFDVSEVGSYWATFENCSSLKEINFTHWKATFDISPSTAFEQSDLINIISNLDTVSNGAVLIMGTTNLNKLTTDQIAVATGKGWTLA